jgi:hypothetical protein
VPSNEDSVDKFFNATVVNSETETPIFEEFTGFDIQDFEDFDVEPLVIDRQPVASSSRRMLTPPGLPPVPSVRELSIAQGAVYRSLEFLISLTQAAVITQELRNRQDEELRVLRKDIIRQLALVTDFSGATRTTPVANSTVDDLFRKISMSSSDKVDNLISDYVAKELGKVKFDTPNGWLATGLQTVLGKRKEGPSEDNKKNKKPRKEDKKGKGKAREE